MIEYTRPGAVAMTFRRSASVIEVLPWKLTARTSVRGPSTMVTATFTGAVPIIYKARRSLLNGLALGFGTDVLLVVGAVVVLLRHWSNGVLLLLTSVFPMVLIFGAMGWLGIVVDIGSVMTPCVALGVTIDYVIHFVLWFRRGIARGLSVPGAVELAYAVTGRQEGSATSSTTRVGEDSE